MNSVKKYCRKHIDSTYKTNEGYDCKIIDGGSKRDYVTIQIKDWISEAKISNVKRGAVKYLFHKSVYNIGYFGDGNYSKNNDKLAYQKWQSMIRRCYVKKYQLKKPAYIGCSVDDEWHNFQDFAKWFYRYYPKDGLKYDIDKDIKVPGNKIYSKNTCIFVQARLNAFMANTQSNNTSGHTGVYWSTRDERWLAEITIDGKTKHLGLFTCARTASSAYKQARQNISKKLRAYYSFDYPKYILDNII